MPDPVPTKPDRGTENLPGINDAVVFDLCHRGSFYDI